MKPSPSERFLWFASREENVTEEYAATHDIKQTLPRQIFVARKYDAKYDAEHMLQIYVCCLMGRCNMLLKLITSQGRVKARNVTLLKPVEPVNKCHPDLYHGTV